MTHKKSMVFLTHAPFGSLGDPSAASKLIKSIKEQYGEEIDISIVLIVEDQNKDMAVNLFNNMNVTVIPMPKLDVHHQKGNVSVDALLKKTNGIIFFPTFHHFTNQEIELVRQYDKQTFIATEYDLYSENKINQLKKLGDFRVRCMQMGTGLAEDKLGIFCTEEQDTSNNRLSLSQINDSSDLAFRELLLDGNNSNTYQDTHQLFFGYFAQKDDDELKGHKAKLKLFIESCLHMVSPEKSTVDFVLPLKPSSGMNQSKSIEELISYFEQHPELIKGYRFEFWIKNKEGTMECFKVGGEGEKLVRFINGYPFTPNTMDKLMKASDEFVMITGDQSLSEAISNEKVFIYQAMYWKVDLWHSLKNIVEECLTKESKLYQFLAMQDKESNTSPNEFKEFLRTHKNELKGEVIKLRTHILAHKNLYRNLPSQLVNYLLNPQNYVADCLSQNETLSYENIRDLLRVFPNEIGSIFTHLFTQGKFDKHAFFELVKADRSSYDEKTFNSILSFFDEESHKEKMPVMSKSMVFLTHAPLGTLGDPSAASKLIKSIKEQYGEGIDISIVLIVEDQDKDKVVSLFNNMDVTVIPMPELDVHHQQGDISVDALLKKTDGIIFFPTFHFFSNNDVYSVKKYDKPTFIVTEYDLSLQNREIQLKKLGNSRSQFMQIDTGLADNKLGIFCTEEQHTSNNRLSLSQINDPSDLAFRELLLDGNDSDTYQDTHQLFFGYFSQLNRELEGHKANPKLFIESCLQMVSPEKNTVDFVLPLQPSSGMNQSKRIEALISYFEQHPELIKGYRFEFWIKNKEGTMECFKVGGEGEKLVRFINGYPFTPNTMDKLMKASDEFVMITGDQSLSEAISNEKIFIYQTMHWKKDLWHSLKNIVEECLTKESKLYQFLAMQDKESNTSPNEFKEFLRTHKNELKGEVIKLRTHIMAHKNLHHNLPSKLVNYLLNTKSYAVDLKKHRLREQEQYPRETYKDKKISFIVKKISFIVKKTSFIVKKTSFFKAVASFFQRLLGKKIPPIPGEKHSNPNESSSSEKYNNRDESSSSEKYSNRDESSSSKKYSNRDESSSSGKYSNRNKKDSFFKKPPSDTSKKYSDTKPYGPK